MHTVGHSSGHGHSGSAEHSTILADQVPMVKTVGAITTAAVRVDAQGNGMHPNALTVCAAILAGCFVALLAALLLRNRRRRTPDIRIRAVRAVTERGPASDSHFGILLAELSVQRT